MKTYHAMIWKRGEEAAGERVTVVAASLDDAREKLEAEHGEGSVFDLHNEEDASRPR